MALFRQYFRVQRTGLLLWAGINGFMGWVLGSSAKQMEAGNVLSDFLTGIIEKLPETIRALMGIVPGLSPVDTLVQGKLGFWMSIALPIYGCLLAVAAVTREIDRGTADFLFALPVKRRQVLIARWSVMVTNVIIVAITTWAALSGGLLAGGVQGNLRGYFWIMIQAALLGVAVGSLALLGSMWSRDYEKAMKRSLGAVLLLFAIDMGMEMAAMPVLVRSLNPYYYFSTLEPLLRSGPMIREAAVLIVVAVVALWASVRVFSQRQIEA
ncbi:MAG: ABC transporter permease subunit [Bacillota bacterium]